MSRRFVHAALVGKYQADGIRPVLEDIAHFLVRQGLEVSLEYQTAQNTGMTDFEALTAAQIGARCDLAVVVGGASLSGGKGSAISAMLGALLIVMMRQGIRTLRLDQNYEWIIIGTALIVAVVLDQRGFKRVSEKFALRR